MSDFKIIKATPFTGESSTLPPHLAHIMNAAMRESQDAYIDPRLIQINQAWQCLACGFSGILIGGFLYHIAFPFQPPVVIEKERAVVVNKEVPVYLKENCVAFCGSK
jgi:hypothetical protein